MKTQTPKLVVPDFECKLYLDAAKVLDVEFRPIEDVRRALKLPDSTRKMSMQFVDARPVKIHPEGWNVRVRKFEDEEDTFELTYKRRYPLGAGTIHDALALAAKEGFHADEPDYQAQVEWGFGKRTLSLSRKKEFKAKGHGDMNLPPIEAVRDAAIKQLPGKLDRWKQAGWARGALAAAILYGPVLGRRWTGRWDGLELAFEVWLIKTESGQGWEPVVELSFKHDKEPKASGCREQLMALLRKPGWLLERDVLKTEVILKRY